MRTGPYLVQDQYATDLWPRIVPYGGWASYKNVISGQYNRHLCWTCAQDKSYPQAPGVYRLNIDDTPAREYPGPAYEKQLDKEYQVYQHHRMSNDPGRVGTDYVNYHNTQCGNLYPKRYVRGYWPDEQKVVTNTPSEGCTTVHQNMPGYIYRKPGCNCPK